MSEVKSPVGFDNRLYAQQNVSNPKMQKTNLHSRPIEFHIQPNADCFVSSITKKPRKQNLLDNCLVHMAPRLYLDKYLDEKEILKAIEQNPKIDEILSSSGVKKEIHMENLQGANREHFLSTYKKAKELSNCLQDKDDTALMKAALLHDIGKVFIPPEILNKPAKLNKEEREIIDLHAKLGAEVLDAMGLDYKVVEAVRYHHGGNKGYRGKHSELTELLSVADVYSALKEERPYKKKFSDDKVRQIMQNDPNLNIDFVNQIFYSKDLSIA